MRTPNFTWDYGKFKDKVENPKEYYKISYSLDTAYEWGSGWTNNQSNDFHSNIEYLLNKEGFKVVVDDLSTTVIGNVSFDKTYLFIHPMEITGYLKEKDIAKLEDKVLGKMPKDIVHSFERTKLKIVPNISDSEYEKILLDNTENIVDWINEAKANRIPDYDIGFEFARNFRIERVLDKSGLSSMDVDVRFVDHLNKINEVLKAKYEKEFSEDKDSFDR